MGFRAETVKHHNKYEKKWKKYLKAPKNHNKMLFSIDKNSGSRREPKKIKNSRAASKKRCNSSSYSSSNESDSDSSLSSDSN